MSNDKKPYDNSNEIGALWQRTTNAGKVYFTGWIIINKGTPQEQKVDVAVWEKNPKFKTEKSPDYEIKIDTYRQNKAAGTPAPAAKPAAPRNAAPARPTTKAAPARKAPETEVDESQFSDDNETV